jgi:hypothetical protein
MAKSQVGGDEHLFTIAEAACHLGCDPGLLLARLIRERFVYRYTGVGRPLAYVRWVRAGLFVNPATEFRITQGGLELVAGALKRP